MSVKKQITLIGAASGWGASNPATEDGAGFLFENNLHKTLQKAGINAEWGEIVQAVASYKFFSIGKRDNKEPLIFDAAKKLSERIIKEIKKDEFTVTLGGDHSCAVGTWSGASHALKAEGEFGLIWLDAHMDAHTSVTADEGKWGGNYHGRPLAWLLGEGEGGLPKLCSNKAKIDPDNVTLIGIRSYEPGEKALLEKLGVRIFYIEEVEEIGFKACFKEALKRAQKGTKGFGMTIDIDGFDPKDAPGTGTAEKNGLRAKEVIPALKNLIENDNFKALEIAEFDPNNDVDNKTLHLIEDLLTSILSNK